MGVDHLRDEGWGRIAGLTYGEQDGGIADGKGLRLDPLKQPVQKLEGGWGSKGQAAGKHREYLDESGVKPGLN
jgi:hypothetical protein